MRPAPPDIVLLDVEWPGRALLRAELIEHGYEVVAVDTWPAMRRYLRPGIKPRLAIVDLQGLPEPERVLSDLRILMRPEQVLVIHAMATLPVDFIRHLGFTIVTRPVSIADIVAQVGAMFGRT